MNKKYSIIVVLMAVVTLMTSCLGDGDSDTTYYDDVAITSFKLGTLSRTVHTTSKKGADSTYTTTVSCSGYLFTIDQDKNLIYNLDSLPKGTKIDKSLVTVSTLNSGYVYLKSLTSDSLSAFQSTDSLDFSQKRIIRCYANDLSWFKDYTVEVRVHKEVEDTLYWNLISKNDNIANLENMKAYVAGGLVYAYGTVNGISKLYASSVKDGTNWSQLNLPSESPFSMIAYGNNLYALSGGTLYSIDSTNESAFGKLTENTSLKSLVAASASAIYAIDNNGKLASSTDNGLTWHTEATSDDIAYLPTRDINSVTTTSITNSDIEKVVILGNRDVTSDKTCMVWSKIVDNGNTKETQDWVYQPFTSETWHHAPALEHMSVIPYSNGMLMLGGKGINSCTNSAFDKLYFSRDNGLNWWNDSRFYLPSGFSSSDTSFAMTTDTKNNKIWILCGKTGQVWCGYLSHLTWE